MEVQTCDIRKAITPLRLVFWGGIICVLDLRINGFDILNDILGAILIACGVFGLGDLRIPGRYRSAMLFIKIVSVLAIAEAINAHVRYQIPRPASFLLHLYGIAKMLATVVFCLAMRWLCLAAGLTKSERSWKTTTILFALIYLAPLGVLHIVWIICLITNNSFHFNIGPAILVALIVFFVPLVHLFVSTSRMQKEAAATPDRAEGPQGVDDHPPTVPPTHHWRSQ
jgi:hypothetical protein